MIIDNGNYDSKNLAILGLGREYFDDLLAQKGIKNIKKILVLTADGTGKIYLQVKNEKFQTFTVEYPGGKVW